MTLKYYWDFEPSGIPHLHTENRIGACCFDIPCSFNRGTCIGSNFRREFAKGDDYV